MKELRAFSIVLVIGFITACTPKASQSLQSSAAIPEKTMPGNPVNGNALPAEPIQGTPLPMDSSIRQGKLSNGLTYYIQHNNKPENRAELRLVVKVGSLQEDPDQLGVAHFVEHMAFNGSEHFSKN
ncbi:MAG: insulinase family protein, partial [Saprospiraceae bacterium]|nr:insulinase family protein [Saprospiraceae bacterium]